MISPQEVPALNHTLTGFTDLLRFDLQRNAGHFNLTLTLANPAGSRLTLTLLEVQNLELNPAGNGFERLVQLQVEDVRDDGLHRINLSLEELKRETLFLHCYDIEVVELTA